MRPRNEDELEDSFKLEKQSEIFFTMKVYANTSNGKLKNLKYSIDFHPPFEANAATTVEPYASPLIGKNKEAFGRIFHNVKEVLRYITDPKGYIYDPYPGDKSSAKKGAPAPFRADEQKVLAEAIRLSKGAINHITYESNSPSSLSVGAVFRATGNGDMKPPPK